MAPVLKKEFERIIGERDEKAARRFLQDHYLELPEKWREGLAWAYFEEASDYAAREAASLAAIQRSALQALDS
ncbi:MAG: hypothetical protein RIQ56_416 [Candidatus Parcubacteria bacterium]|jgi:hypothetical protein